MKHEVSIPDDAAPGRHGVYVAFDAAGEVLYIGRTQNLEERLRGHRWTSEWHQRMRSIEWTPCVDLVEARRVEKSLISAFRPATNQNDRALLRAGRHALPSWTAEKLRSLYPGHDLELNGYIRALRAGGWPLASIGAPLAMTREAVRIRESAEYVRVSFGVPRVPVAVKAPPVVRPDVTPGQRRRLLEMHAVARAVNGSTAADDPARAVSVSLTEYIAELHLSGIPIGRIAEAIGVSYLAVKLRLARHGYLQAPPSLRHVVYKGQPTHRVRTCCKRGHEFTSENTRLINGDPTRRICRACERIRVTAYRSRKKAAA